MITSLQLANAGINPDEYEKLSDEEKLVVNQILEEMATSNSSELYESLYYADYDEIPVDFVTFITDDNYLGKSTRNGQFLYPFWKKEAQKIFSRSDISEVALSGCLSGDTLIPLVDGTSVPIKDLVGRTKFKVYSYDLESNKYVVGNAVKAFSTGYKMTYNVTFDNGETIRITGNHKFLTRDKHYKSIDDGLKVGDSIMPFNTYIDEKGYEILRHPQKDGTYIEEPTHRMVMRSKLGKFKGTVHHKDYNKRNNLPSNLQLMTWSRHRHFHAVRGTERFKEFTQNWNSGNVSEDTRKRYIEGKIKGIRSRWSDPDQHIKASIRTSLNNFGNTYGKNISEESREIKRKRTIEYNKTSHPRVIALNRFTKDQVLDAIRTTYTPGQASDKLGISCTGFWSLCSKYEIEYKVNQLKTPFDLPNRYWTARLSMFNYVYSKYGELNNEVLLKEYPEERINIDKVVEKYFNSDYQAFFNIVKNFNHKIVSIYLNDIEEVYDIEVEKYHNFALSAGVIVHNSIGVGKTTAGVLMMIYHLYRTMCMKDPQAFFNLSPGSEITYAFLNNTMSSSYGVAYKTFQAFVQESPWFLKHGMLSGRAEQTYTPEKGFGFVVGSKPQHTLGRHVICLTSDTVIETSEGDFRIDSLEGKDINVFAFNEKENKIELSEKCTVCCTGEVSSLIEIELEDGTILKCTEDHRFLLKDGTYKSAKDLTDSDEILDINTR